MTDSARQRTHEAVPERADVVVIGAGIVGLACGHALAEAGLDTVVLDRGLPGAENSVRTGGGVRAQFATATNVALSLLSLPTWEAFEERFGVAPVFRQIGYLFLVRSDRQALRLREQVAFQNALGVDSELLERSELRRRWPDLHLDSFEAGAFHGRDGYLDQHRAVQGFLREASRAGARILAGTEVTGVLRTMDAVTGVDTTRGRIEAGVVVNAAGGHAGRIAAMAGHELPISPRRHELIVVRPSEPVPDDIPWLIDVEGQVHMRPDGQGRALVGGFLGEDLEVDPDRYDPRFDSAWARGVLAAAHEAFGLVDPDAEILRGWAGVYPSTPDHHPVIERTSHGYVTAAGFSGTGLMHAPAAGTLVREIVTEGAPRSVDPQKIDLTSARFRDGIDTVETSGF